MTVRSNMQEGDRWAYAPGSVGNLICGFDVLGVAMEGPGDLVRVGRRQGVGVTLILQGGEGVAADPEKNTASVAATAVAHRLGFETGLEIEIFKGLPLSGGMGGSAASAVAGAVAAHALLSSAGRTLSDQALAQCALEGELIASGAIHGDNVAPSLLGGIVLARTHPAVHLVSLPVPEGATVVVVHPQQKMDTKTSRDSIGDSVPLKSAVRQWANTATLVAGLFRSDWDLIALSLYDEIAEPRRKGSIPGFDQVVTAAKSAGASGVSLSGAGPSIFAFCAGREIGEKVGAAMKEAFTGAGVSSTAYVTAVGSGAHVVSQELVEQLDPWNGYTGNLEGVGQ